MFWDRVCRASGGGGVESLEEFLRGFPPFRSQDSGVKSSGLCVLDLWENFKTGKEEIEGICNKHAAACYGPSLQPQCCTP